VSAPRHIVGVDLFCGAGGFSEGLSGACADLGYRLHHAAINHWDPAIETHARNHPEADQYHSKVEQLHPPDVVRDLLDGERVDADKAFVILVAGPECTHFSNARGGKPVNEQKRMSPWHVLDWLEKLDVDAFIIENVGEIQDWGPVEDGQPTRDGSVFDAWVNALNKLGYSVDWTVLNAADYGDPTSRKRFFLVGRQTGQATFPDPTHSDDVDGLPDHRTAAEIIDWADLGGSIWTRDLEDGRKTPPKHSTMQRIAEGIRRHCDDRLEPFADALAQLGRDEIRTLREERVVPASDAGVVADAVDEPFLVDVEGAGTALSVSKTHLLRQQDGAHPVDVDGRPVPTIATRGGHAVVTTATRPLVMPRNGARRGLHSNPLYAPEARPLHTVTAKNTDGYLVSPYLCPLYNGREGQRPRTRSLTRPLLTVTASKSVAGLSTPVVRPFIDDCQGPPQSPSRPLKTQPASDRYALCVPELWPWGLDVRYRMLQPRELKQAQGFPAGYDIAGTKSERTEQIGNAVPVNLARALCKHLLTADDPSLATYGGGISADPDADIPDYDEVVSDD
jgi:DNA (cytosine-5)-methyltransferase 1